jgi:hypothetical protein
VPLSTPPDRASRSSLAPWPPSPPRSVSSPLSAPTVSRAEHRHILIHSSSPAPPHLEPRVPGAVDRVPQGAELEPHRACPPSLHVAHTNLSRSPVSLPRATRARVWSCSKQHTAHAHDHNNNDNQSDEIPYKSKYSNDKTGCCLQRWYWYFWNTQTTTPSVRSQKGSGRDESYLHSKWRGDEREMEKPRGRDERGDEDPGSGRKTSARP